VPVRFALVALSTVEVTHGVLNLLDITLEVGHRFVVAIDGRRWFTPRRG